MSKTSLNRLFGGSDFVERMVRGNFTRGKCDSIRSIDDCIREILYQISSLQ
jgi:hypothetical protein